MTQQITADEVKQRHRALWALGDYPAVASEVIAGLGPRLVEAVAPVAGERVLDVAAGSGNASIPAARTGAHVVASDLTPELLAVGERQAAALGVELEWQVGDAENLPSADDDFDVVMSCVGVMFAPQHQAGADEILRVLRPGGRIGLVSWTPEGFIGQMFATMRPFAPAPPPGAQPPPLWGRPEHLDDLFGSRVSDVVASRELLDVGRFGSATAFRDFFKAAYGPTIATYRAIADDPDRTAALDQALVDLAADHDRGDGAMQWEYLLYSARKR